MKISCIVAMTLDGVIGDKGALPWRLPSDLRWFRRNTLYKPLIMGRKTYDSLSGPLAKRKNIVLSHQPQRNPNVTWARSPYEALQAAGTVEEIMIIGGSTLYRTFLPYSHRIYLTYIHAHIPGDTTIPEFVSCYERAQKAEDTTWQLTFRSLQLPDPNHAHPFEFIILERLFPPLVMLR